MPVILPLIFGVGVFAAIFVLSLDKEQRFHLSFFYAAIILGLYLTFLTEFLSLFQILSFTWTVAAWTGGIVLVALFYYMSRRGHTWSAFKLRSYNKFEIILGVGIFFIISWLAVIAWFAPSNDLDSMTYHLSRVAHWIQNRTIAFFPALDLRQLRQPPWAEYAILNLQILSRGDRLANYVQWFSMVGSLLGVMFIAAQLGGKPRGAALAALFAATLPMGIYESTTAQNDYVVSFWLVVFVSFFLLSKNNSRLLPLMASSAALGLALLTKATAYIYAAPFVVWLAYHQLRKQNIKAIKILLIMAAIVLLINAPHYQRNYQLFGKPLGLNYEGTQADRFKYSNDSFALPLMASNVMRNLAIHLTTPFTALNKITEKGMLLIHQILRVAINDPRTTFTDTSFSVQWRPTAWEFAGNPLHLGVFVFSLIVMIYVKEIRKLTGLTHYALAALSAWLLFCFYLKWQPCHGRLHLPFFILLSPIVGVVLARIKSRKLIYGIIPLLILCSFYPLLYNYSKPVIARENIFNTKRVEQWLKFRRDQIDTYREAADFLLTQRGCSQYGLMMMGENIEYPLWVILQDHPGKSFRMENVFVINHSATFTDDSFTSCALLLCLPVQMDDFLAAIKEINLYFPFPADRLSAKRKASLAPINSWSINKLKMNKPVVLNIVTLLSDEYRHPALTVSDPGGHDFITCDLYLYRIAKGKNGRAKTTSSFPPGQEISAFKKAGYRKEFFCKDVGVFIKQ